MDKFLRGLARLSKEERAAFASAGGKAAHRAGTAHEFDSKEASAAAAKGHRLGTSHEFTPEEARAAGRKGGKRRWANAIRCAQCNRLVHVKPGEVCPRCHGIPQTY